MKIAKRVLSNKAHPFASSIGSLLLVGDLRAVPLIHLLQIGARLLDQFAIDLKNIRGIASRTLNRDGSSGSIIQDILWADSTNAEVPSFDKIPRRPQHGKNQKKNSEG